jgi:hypothetical protein
MTPGCVQIKHRKNGATAGSSDIYYRSPSGKRYRSRKEVVADLGLLVMDEKRLKPGAPPATSHAFAADAQRLVEKLKLQVPHKAGYGVTVKKCVPALDWFETKAWAFALCVKKCSHALPPQQKVYFCIGSD